MSKTKKNFLVLTFFIIDFILIFNIKARQNEDLNNETKINNYLVSKTEDNTDDDQYIGYIYIPTINLKRGFYSLNSNFNDVNKNIQVIADEMDNLLILAAHRGNSKVSFFQNLEKMSLGDEIYLDYKHTNYKYRLYYKYYENKDGNLSIKYDNTKNVLVLITCVRELKDKQVIYVAYKI